MIITPESNPNHHTVGKYFRGWDTLIYYCDSYDDSSCRYWMTEVGNPENRKNVSERAIGRTIHEIRKRES